MYSGDIYTESELKTLLSCSRLYLLNGDIQNYDISQRFVQQSLRYFINALLTPTSLDLDYIINNSVNKSYIKIYGKNFHKDLSEVTRLKSYAFLFINNFILKLNLNKCDILLGPTRPRISLPSSTFELEIDAIFKPKNRKKQLHAVCFYPYIDQHLLNNDITLSLKLDYLNKFAHSSINTTKYSQVNLHLFSISKFDKYKSKSRENRIQYKHLKYDDAITFNLKNIDKAISDSLSKAASPIYCYNSKCSKRKECLNAW